MRIRVINTPYHSEELANGTEHDALFDPQTNVYRVLSPLDAMETMLFYTREVKVISEAEAPFVPFDNEARD